MKYLLKLGELQIPVKLENFFRENNVSRQLIEPETCKKVPIARLNAETCEVLEKVHLGYEYTKGKYIDVNKLISQNEYLSQAVKGKILDVEKVVLTDCIKPCYAIKNYSVKCEKSGQIHSILEKFNVALVGRGMLRDTQRLFAIYACDGYLIMTVLCYIAEVKAKQSESEDICDTDLLKSIIRLVGEYDFAEYKNDYDSALRAAIDDTVDSKKTLIYNDNDCSVYLK